MAGAIVPAAGRGTRFGSRENKIWTEIGGRAVLSWTLSAFQSHPEIEEIVLVGSPEEMIRLRHFAKGFPKVRNVVAGGASRQESVGNGLAVLDPKHEIVLVHDAARPAVSSALISRIIQLATIAGAAVPGIRVGDTLQRISGDDILLGTVSRDGLAAIQTPQGARSADLRAAYEKLGPEVARFTDESTLLAAAGYPVAMAEGEESNIKITKPEDAARIAAILASAVPTPDTRYPTPDTLRTGFGYDVHAFAEQRALWLGGVEIPHARGLAGHSDADVVLHAVCDALLGAAGMGDIGVLFPDSDAAHKDRPSIEFVREVRARLHSGGWSIGNVDIALLAEEPRIGPHREAMVAAISDALIITAAHVNIKATTSERMGFVGRGEGIACWAVATIFRLERDTR